MRPEILEFLLTEYERTSNIQPNAAQNAAPPLRGIAP